MSGIEQQPVPHEEGMRKFGEMLEILRRDEPEKILDIAKQRVLEVEKTADRKKRPKRNRVAKKITPMAGENGLWENLPARSDEDDKKFWWRRD